MAKRTWRYNAPDRKLALQLHATVAHLTADPDHTRAAYAPTGVAVDALVERLVALRDRFDPLCGQRALADATHASVQAERKARAAAGVRWLRALRHRIALARLEDRPGLAALALPLPSLHVDRADAITRTLRDLRPELGRVAALLGALPGDPFFDEGLALADDLDRLDAARHEAALAASLRVREVQATRAEVVHELRRLDALVRAATEMGAPVVPGHDRAVLHVHAASRPAQRRPAGAEDADDAGA